jgi:DNA-binding transcriptional regulator YdaS (Cro superfamily)
MSASASKIITPLSESKVAKFIAKRIDELQGVKSQRDIAREMGYERPNIVSMFKTGDTKVPLEKIPALARAIDSDPAELFRISMEQYWPELYGVIRDIFGDIVSKDERDLIALVRKEMEKRDVTLTPEIKKAIAAAIKSTVT